MGPAEPRPRSAAYALTLFCSLLLLAAPLEVHTLGTRDDPRRGSRADLREPLLHGPKTPRDVLCDQTAWPVPMDGALCEAAQWLAARLDGRRTGGDHPCPDSEALLLRRALRSNGVIDAHVSARIVRAESYGALFARVEALVEAHATPLSHAGVGLAPGSAGAPWAVVLMSRRLVHPRPFAAKLAPGERVELEFRLGPGARDPEGWLGIDGGPVIPVDLALVSKDSGDSGRYRLETPRLPEGHHDLQVLVDAGQGLEVAFTAPMRVGHPAPRSEPSFLIRDQGDPTALVRQALADHRRAVGLPASTRDPRLEELAAARGRMMIGTDRPVHVPAPDVDAEGMLLSRGYSYSWTGESLSVGPTVASAFQGLLDSPAHRRILEHPRARRQGVFVAMDDDRVWITMLLADPTETTASSVPTALAADARAAGLLHRAQDAVGEARRRRGLRAPVRDPALDSIAEELVGQLAARDVSRDAAAQAEARRRALEVDRLAVSVTVEVVVGGRPEDLARAPALVEDACHRVGLAIAEADSTSFEGRRLWLGAICARRGGGTR